MDNNCKCLLWTSHDLGRVLLTGHHETCPNNPGVESGFKNLVTALVRGIENWASQEDGIPDELWDSYAFAKRIIGEPIPDPPVTP